MTEAKKKARFVSMIRAQCRALGIRFYRGRGKTVRCGSSMVSGYFDESYKILAFAGKRRDWLEVLSHESCHMDQWSEKSQAWKGLGNSGTAFDEWLDGKEMPRRVTKKHAMAVLRMELDCEKRSIRKLKENGLKFDRKRYVKKANAYLFLYHWLLEVRRWPNKRSPYRDPVIVERCASRFHRSYSRPPKGLMDLYNKRKSKMLTASAAAQAG